MATGSIPTVTLERNNEIVASAGTQIYTLTIRNTDSVNATVKVSVNVPLAMLETTRAFVSAGSGVSGNTASGATNIADAAVILTGVGSYVTYTITSTLTLPTGRTYGRSTIFPTVTVVQRPNGTSVTEAAQVRTLTTFVGPLTSYGLSAFGQIANEKNRHADEQQIAFRLVGIGDTEASGQQTIDVLDNGPKTSWDTVKALFLQGSKMRVVAPPATGTYVVQETDGLILCTGTANTVTMPSITDPNNLGRFIKIINKGSGAVTFNGGTADGSTLATASVRTYCLVDSANGWYAC